MDLLREWRKFAPASRRVICCTVSPVSIVCSGLSFALRDLAGAANLAVLVVAFDSWRHSRFPNFFSPQIAEQSGKLMAIKMANRQGEKD
jgi:hypothetical protein